MQNFHNQKDGLTQEQKIYIIENYTTMKTRDICKELNVSYERVHSYAQLQHLKKNQYASQSYNHYFEELLSRRNNPNYNINDYLGNSAEPTVDTLYKSKYGKYNVNQDYFDVIDNEWKAYWLGFLYADGTNRIAYNEKTHKMAYSLKLCLCAEDKQHLEKFKSSLQSDAPIKDRIAKLNDKYYPSCDFGVCNKNICESLQKLGCIPNKSLVLQFPTENQVPSNLIRHFIRGYFDGDGCIHINLKERHACVLFEGTKDFLTCVRDILYKELNVKLTDVVQSRSRAYHIRYGKFSDIELIYKYLYKDCNVYLDRKLKKFDTLYCLD